jgi:hypothetical protein
MRRTHSRAHRRSRQISSVTYGAGPAKAGHYEYTAYVASAFRRTEAP